MQNFLDVRQINRSLRREQRQQKLFKALGWLAYAVGAFLAGIIVGHMLASTMEPSKATIIFSAAIGGIIVWFLRELFNPL